MYSCFADVERACAGRGIAPARLFLENEMRLTGRTEKEIYDLMDARLTIMEDAAGRALTGPLGSVGGLIDGLAQAQWNYAKGAQTLCGAFLNRVMARALSCSEVNASMGRICAAPTAGSCGILPAVLLTTLSGSALGNARYGIVAAVAVIFAVCYLFGMRWYRTWTGKKSRTILSVSGNPTRCKRGASGSPFLKTLPTI